FDRHHAPVLRHARGLLGNAADAEDVMQEVWVSVVRKIGTLQHPEAFRSWMYRIARNRCMSRLRRSRSYVPLDDAANAEQLTISVSETGDESASLAPPDAAALDAGLARLS